MAHEEIGRAVWADINRALTCYEAFSALTAKPIKVLQVYKTIGVLFPNTLLCDLTITLARLFDTDTRSTAASLNNLLRLAQGAQGAMAPAGFDEYRAATAKAKKYLQIARNKHLAHRDIASNRMGVKIDKLVELLDLAKDIHRATMKVLMPKHTWVYGYASASGDAKAVVELLAAWDYPPMEQRRATRSLGR